MTESHSPGRLVDGRGHLMEACCHGGTAPGICCCVSSALRERHKLLWRKQMFPVVSQRKNRQEHIWEERYAKDPSESAFGGLKAGFGESRDEEGALLGGSSGAKQRSTRGTTGCQEGFRFCAMTLRRSVTCRPANPSHPLH